MYPSATDNKRKLQNVNSTVEFWLDEGATSTKLNLGIALYGRSFTLFDTNQFGIGAPTLGPGKPGKVIVNFFLVLMVN